jgi:hypothetical protein
LEVVWKLGFEIWNSKIRMKGESEENYNFIVGDADLFGGVCQEGSAEALWIDRSHEDR